MVNDGRWSKQSANDFLKLLNKFYNETKFSEFYEANINFYKLETQIFIDRTYSEIDLKWFDSYTQSDNLRCVYSPSNTLSNYAATVNDIIVYCAVTDSGSSIVHEYCHSFANPLAYEWYNSDLEFKKWCDDTIDTVNMPYYGNGNTIAGEYVTRAYNALYYYEHGYELEQLFLREKKNGFPYIEEVYAMIAPIK